MHRSNTTLVYASPSNNRKCYVDITLSLSPAPALRWTPVPARGRVVWRAILVVAGCVVVDEPDVGRSCSRRRRAALCTQWCKPIPPCPTQGAVFLFLLESFKWLHRWHGHDEARRVADRSVDFIEGGREGDWTRRDGFGMQIEVKIIQFLFVESILIYIRDLQYRSELPPPNIEWRESQGDTQLVVRGARSVRRRRFYFWKTLNWEKKGGQY